MFICKDYTNWFPMFNQLLARMLHAVTFVLSSIVALSASGDLDYGSDWRVRRESSFGGLEKRRPSSRSILKAFFSVSVQFSSKSLTQPRIYLRHGGKSRGTV